MKIQTRTAEKGSDFLFQFLDLVVDVLPHVSMKRQGQFTKRAGQDGSFKEFFKQVLFFLTTDRARKRDFIFHERVLIYLFSDEEAFHEPWVDLFLGTNPSKLLFEEIEAEILESKKVNSSVLISFHRT